MAATVTTTQPQERPCAGFIPCAVAYPTCPYCDRCGRTREDH